jgi:hypothetical protein
MKSTASRLVLRILPWACAALLSGVANWKTLLMVRRAKELGGRDVLLMLTGHAPNQFLFVVIFFPIAAVCVAQATIEFLQLAFRERSLFITVTGYTCLLFFVASMVGIPFILTEDAQSTHPDLYTLEPPYARAGASANSAVIGELRLYQGDARKNAETALWSVLSSRADDYKADPKTFRCPEPRFDFAKGTQPALPARISDRLLTNAKYLQDLYYHPKDALAGNVYYRYKSGERCPVSDKVLTADAYTAGASVTVASWLVWLTVATFAIRLHTTSAVTQQTLRALATLLAVGVGAASFWFPFYKYNLNEISLADPTYDPGNLAPPLLMVGAAVVMLIVIFVRDSSEYVTKIAAVSPVLLSAFTTALTWSNPYLLGNVVGSDQKPITVLTIGLIYVVVTVATVFGVVGSWHREPADDD